MVGKSGKLFDIQKNDKDNPILKALESELGYTATQSILSNISSTLGMSKQKILSDYETFSKVVKQVYDDAGEK
ncbi:MAG: hypothetical protein ACE5RT_05320, partial [Nitrosopumilaceae archaeon]